METPTKDKFLEELQERLSAIYAKIIMKREEKIKNKEKERIKEEMSKKEGLEKTLTGIINSIKETRL